MKAVKFSQSDVFRKQMEKQRKERKVGFKTAIKYLEDNFHENCLIVETGTVRTKDEWYGDGQSTIIFDEFVNFYNGRVISVDNDMNAVKLANNATSDKVEVLFGNSINVLYELQHQSLFSNLKQINLLYLDSWGWDDINQDLTPQAIHALMELTAVMQYLHTNSLVMIDDNLDDGRGKGALVREFARKVGWEQLYNGYVILYRVI